MPICSIPCWSSRTFEWLGSSNFDVFALRRFDQARAAPDAHSSRASRSKTAFDNFEFVVRYQPKVRARRRLRSGKRGEAEALVRWLHPEQGLIAPMEFLPEIEAYGLMPKLTEYCDSQGCGRRSVKWREQGLGLDVCVNLASSQLGTIPAWREGIRRNRARARRGYVATSLSKSSSRISRTPMLHTWRP